MSLQRGFISLVAAGLIVAVTTAGVQADTVVYNNLTTFSGFAYANGGATNQAGNTITTMVADDITPGAGLVGSTINSFTFTVANLNAVAVSARARVRFYAGNGTDDGPGTYLNGFSFNPITFNPGTVAAFTVSQAGMFVMPTLLWAGITFDDNTGTTGATAAQLNNLGQGIFNPPTVGSSDDVFFQTAAAGSFVQNNPPGGFFWFGGSPAASFGWSFSGTAAVPEPSPLLLGSGLVVVGGLFRLARNRLLARAA